LETMFQLIHLRFTQPRADPTAFQVLQGNMKTSLPQQRSHPAFLFSEALTSAPRGNHPRTRPITVETVDQLDLQKSMAFYKDRFGDAGDFDVRLRRQLRSRGDEAACRAIPRVAALDRARGIVEGRRDPLRQGSDRAAGGEGRRAAK